MDLSTPRCLPYPWPVPEPEPEPGDLGEEINWRTYSHRELYRMATTGLDLEGADEVAGQWSRLGGELDDIGRLLKQALEQAADGWQGAAAEEARGKVEQLSSWTRQTAEGSVLVSECVSKQADLARVTKNTMPEPPLLPAPVVPLRGEAEPARLAEAPGGFASAPDLVTDPAPERERARQLHQQAAEVMERYQHQSNEIYRSVPTFSAPSGDHRITQVPEDPPKRDPEPPGRGGEDDDTSASAVSPGAAAPVAGMPAAGGFGPAGGAPVAPAPGGFLAAEPAPDARSAAGAPAHPGTSPHAAAAATGQRGTGMPGAMPMGMAAARPGGGEDTERTAPSYLQEEDDTWGVQTPVMPPVLGERPPGGR
ncbi:hypothetical protein ACFS2C_27675 [Prauserella oleivorans]|uniref:PPE family protein n=1 Tax=Prauserella oleivorans TaxID=1478153 RepID=A0ABW5WGR3_9PSEU